MREFCIFQVSWLRRTKPGPQREREGEKEPPKKEKQTPNYLLTTRCTPGDPCKPGSSPPPWRPGAEAASKLASKGAEAAAAPFLRTAASSSSSRPPPLTETNLLPPASFTRAAVSRALQAAQTHQHQLEMQQQLQQQQRHQSPSVPAARAAADTEPSAAASEAAALVSSRLAVALIRSLLRSPRARRALSDPASRMELEAFCLAGARSRDATELYRDLKSGAVFR